MWSYVSFSQLYVTNNGFGREGNSYRELIGDGFLEFSIFYWRKQTKMI